VFWSSLKATALGKHNLKALLTYMLRASQLVFCVRSAEYEMDISFMFSFFPKAHTENALDISVFKLLGGMLIINLFIFQ
jgi:hypothetical protein